VVIDPDNIQFCSQKWFWKGRINSYAIQFEPDRSKEVSEMNTSNMQADRLRELLEFAQQSALLRASPIPDIARYGIYHKYENAIADLPGLAFNKGAADGVDEIWVVIERLQESPVPQPESYL
jgi:hypothetical protein